MRRLLTPPPGRWFFFGCVPGVPDGFAIFTAALLAFRASGTPEGGGDSGFLFTMEGKIRGGNLDGNSFGRAGAHPYRGFLMAEGHVQAMRS